MCSQSVTDINFFTLWLEELTLHTNKHDKKNDEVSPLQVEVFLEEIFIDSWHWPFCYWGDRYDFAFTVSLHSDIKHLSAKRRQPILWNTVSWGTTSTTILSFKKWVLQLGTWSWFQMPKVWEWPEDLQAVKCWEEFGDMLLGCVSQKIWIQKEFRLKSRTAPGNRY